MAETKVVGATSKQRRNTFCKTQKTVFAANHIDRRGQQIPISAMPICNADWYLRLKKIVVFASADSEYLQQKNVL